MNDSERGESLRQALSSALSEREAVEAMFREDTGADDVSIHVNGLNTVVRLTYDTEGTA